MSGPSKREGSARRDPRCDRASLAVVAILFVFVFPTRSYLAQRGQVERRAQHDVRRAAASRTTSSQREAKQLQTPAEIERMAREQFNMVYPGEQAYNVGRSPAPATTTTTVP